MASLGTDGIDIELPKGIDSDAVDTTTGPNGEAVVTANETLKEVDFTVSGDTDLTGATIKSSEIEVKAASKKDTVSLTVDSSGFKKSEIVVKKGNADITFNTTVKKSEITLGKGDDNIRFNLDTSFKGKTNIDLGKGGRDSIVIEADKIRNGKLVVTSFNKRDTITVGEETFTYKDIKNGAEIPGVKIELA